MQKVLLVLVFLAAALMMYTGVLWVIDPDAAAEVLKARLLSGTGLATQIGDSAGFFLGTGGLLMWGLLSRNPTLITAGGLIVGIVAPARVAASMLHGASWTYDAIAVEVVVCVVAIAAARGMRR